MAGVLNLDQGMCEVLCFALFCHQNGLQGTNEDRTSYEEAMNPTLDEAVGQ